MPPFKYWNHFVTFNLTSKCPPASATELQRVAFRYVWTINPESFVPVALMPNKRPHWKGHANKPSCGALGLSMFLTEEQARTRFAEMEEERPEIRKTTGTHLAEVNIMPFHGRQDAPKPNGHFNLHEYAGTDLTAWASMIGAL